MRETDRQTDTETVRRGEGRGSGSICDKPYNTFNMVRRRFTRVPNVGTFFCYCRLSAE